MKPVRRRSLLRSKEFLGLALGALAIALVGPLTVALLGVARVEAALVQDEFDALALVSARLLPEGADLLEEGAGERLRRLAELANVRLSVLDAQGTVVADSVADPEASLHEGRRPEVRAAYEDPVGSARRRAGRGAVDPEAEWLFVARRVEVDGRHVGFLRVGRSLVDQERVVQALRDALRTAIVVALVAALVGIAWGAWQWFVPITALTSFARSLARGSTDAEPPVHVGSFARLGRALLSLDKQARKQIAALSKDDAQLRAILTSMVEGILAVNQDDRVVFANSAARASLGVEGDLRGEVLWTRAPIVELEEVVSAARTNGRPERREVTSLRTGTEKIFAMHASPFEAEGEAGVVVVVQDLTELRRLERVRRDFVANVSHELKTPLTAIGGFVDTILDGGVDRDRERHFLERVQSNVARLKALVSDLLSLARIESGKQALDLVPVDWSGIVEAVFRRQEEVARSHGVVLKRLGDRSGVVIGDRSAMTQVVENLVDNGVKYTPGPGEVRVSLRRVDGRVRLAVEDTGVGIPREDRERVFERFYRVDKARSREVGGTGLGLSIVKNLVLSMHGRVWLVTPEAGGTRFEVELPTPEA